jgi:hypothetical protein
LPDTYSKDLRDLVDKILTIDINQRIPTKEILPLLYSMRKIQVSFSSDERAYLDKLLAEKGKQLSHNIYRGSVDGFMAADFHSLCDGVGPTVSLFKIKGNQHWIGGYTTV